MHRYDGTALPALDDDVRASLTNHDTVVLSASQELQESSWRHPPSVLDRRRGMTVSFRRRDYPALGARLACTERMTVGGRVLSVSIAIAEELRGRGSGWQRHRRRMPPTR